MSGENQGATAKHPSATPDASHPASASMYGGQAVIEGVMMRGIRHFAVACRRADGTIASTCELVPKVLRPNWQRWPFLRGGFALVDSMALGTRALFWAAKIAESGLSPTAGTNAETPKDAALEREIVKEAEGAALTGAVPGPAPAALSDTAAVGASGPSGSGKVADIAIGSAMIVGLASAVFLFKILPQFGLEFLKSYLKAAGWATWQLGLADFAMRFTIFVTYITLVSRMEYVYRVFQYHGAEHKAINALEAGQELTVENARAASRLHPRCGTSFIFIVIFLSVLAISPFYDQPLWVRILIQLALLLPVAGVSFELLRLAGKFRDNPIANALSQPGMWTQYLTTREPDDSQLEVSLASLKAVMEAEEQEKASASEAPAAAVA